jgi:phage-related minor tail protein
MTDSTPGAAAELGATAAAAEALRSQVSGLARDLTAELASSTRAIRDTDREARSLGRTLSSSLTRAFDKLVFKGESLSSVLRDVALGLAKSTISAAMAPISSAVSSGVGSLAGALFSGVFADGGAFSSGRVRAFANGGVVNGPTVFPMRSGVGLMGEAGPEAIMPLTRGSDGRLGVAASGGASAPSVTVNIAAKDVESFRRSRSQVAASVARAVARGNRRL